MRAPSLPFLYAPSITCQQSASVIHFCGDSCFNRYSEQLIKHQTRFSACFHADRKLNKESVCGFCNVGLIEPVKVHSVGEFVALFDKHPKAASLALSVWGEEGGGLRLLPSKGVNLHCLKSKFDEGKVLEPIVHTPQNLLDCFAKHKISPDTTLYSHCNDYLTIRNGSNKPELFVDVYNIDYEKSVPDWQTSYEPNKIITPCLTIGSQIGKPTERSQMLAENLSRFVYTLSNQDGFIELLQQSVLSLFNETTLERPSSGYRKTATLPGDHALLQICHHFEHLTLQSFDTEGFIEGSPVRSITLAFVGGDPIHFFWRLNEESKISFAQCSIGEHELSPNNDSSSGMRLSQFIHQLGQSEVVLSPHPYDFIACNAPEHQKVLLPLLRTLEQLK